MIEQINGVGLSGIAGKAAKAGQHGKNSLFTKLMAMLEKQMSGHEKGLSRKVSQSDQGGFLAVLSDRSDPLIAKKSEHLLTLATKGKNGEKRGDKTQTADLTTPLLAAHVIIDTSAPAKKADQAGKVSMLFQAQQRQSNSEQVSTLLNRTLHAESKGMETAAGKTIEPGQAIPKNKASINSGSESTELPLKKSVMNASQIAAIASNPQPSGQSVDAVNTLQRPEQIAKATEQNAKITGQSAKATEQNTKVTEQIAKDAVQIAKDAVKSGKATVQQQAMRNSIELGQKASHSGGLPGAIPPSGAIAQTTSGTTIQAAAQEKLVLGNKTEMQPKSETINVVATHLQQSKMIQSQQIQNSAATVVMPASSQAIVSDSSFAGSGFGSSDQGGEDSSHLSGLNGEVKSSHSTASMNANFQSYLSSKSTPSMSLFDSINHIAQSAKNGKTKLEIQLEPANLGKIQISLQSDAAKQLQVHLIVDQSATRQLIDQQLPALKQALAQQGFDLSGFSMGSHGEQQSSSKFSDRSRGSASTGSDVQGDSASNSLHSVAPTGSVKLDGSLSIRV